MLPIHTIFVRHGKSEGNEAGERARPPLSDESAYTREFIDRHSAYWRLTDQGIREAKNAGHWLKDWLHERKEHLFQGHFVTSHLRGLETAGHLDLPYAKWKIQPLLRERDWGHLDTMPPSRRAEVFPYDVMGQKSSAPLNWTPPNGEDLLTKSLFVDRVLQTLHREYSDADDVVIVCHGETMLAADMLLRRLSFEDLRRITRSRDPRDKIHNCQIIVYSRRDPDTGVLYSSPRWRLSVCPWDTTRSNDVWEPIVRKTYSNDDLLSLVGKYPRLVNDK